MPVPDELFVLAADHRWQWHEWCDANRRPRSVIPELKAIAVEGFLAARERSAAVAAKGAMLLDEQYAAPLIRDLSRRGVLVAAPAERAGAFPLEWACEPFWASLTGSMAKVLVRYRPDDAEERVETERRRLRELGDWCRAHDHRWMLEVVVPCAPDDDEREFARHGRPAAVAQYIEQAYAAGIVPTYWKMEGTTSGEAAAAVDAAIRAQSGVGFLVLGKAAPLTTIAQWFQAARTMPSSSGFAIGRSIYWDPAARFATGEIGRAEAVAAVTETYLATIALWEPSGRGPA